MADPRRTADRHTTMRDVASAVGVDVSTVSKVLNADSGISVRPETRQRILAEVDRLGYYPDANARSLKIRRTGAVGIVIPDLTNPVYAIIVRGAVRAADALGFATLITEPREDDPRPLTRLVRERRIDGLLIATAQSPFDAVLDEGTTAVPHVYLNRRVSAAGSSVIVDDRAAGDLAARTLIDAGHTGLAFIGGPDSVDTARRRREGFMDAAARAGLKRPLDIVQPYSRAGGYQAASIIAADGGATGVFASNLLVGRGLLAGLRSADIAVPEQLSVVSLEDEDAAYTDPPLTTVSLPFSEMGQAAVEELRRAIDGEEPRDRVVRQPVRVIRRESVAVPPR
jgi:LacI family transcriptional regulator